VVLAAPFACWAKVAIGMNHSSRKDKYVTSTMTALIREVLFGVVYKLRRRSDRTDGLELINNTGTEARMSDYSERAVL
jgi:hypothetical protein